MMTGEPLIPPAPPPIGPTNEAVTLARMEGTLNLVAFQVGNLAPRVQTLETHNYENRSRIKSIEQSMVSEAEKAIALAAALKDADEKRRNESEAKWTPFQRGMAVLICVFGGLTILIQLGAFR